MVYQIPLLRKIKTGLSEQQVVARSGLPRRPGWRAFVYYRKDVPYPGAVQDFT
jgi:hypothetical protein